MKYGIPNFSLWSLLLVGCFLCSDALGAQNATVYNVGSTNMTGGTFWYHYKVGSAAVVSTSIGSPTIAPGGSAYYASRGYTNAQNMITWVKSGVTYYPVQLNGYPFTGGADASTWFNNTADGIGWNVGFAPFTPATSTYTACVQNTTATPGTAVFTKNGSVVSSQPVAAFAQVCYTYPEVSPSDVLAWSCSFPQFVTTDQGDGSLSLSNLNLQMPGGAVSNLSSSSSSTNAIALPRQTAGNYATGGEVDFGSGGGGGATETTLAGGINALLQSQNEILQALMNGNGTNSISITSSNGAGWTNGLTLEQFLSSSNAAGLAQVAFQTKYDADYPAATAGMVPYVGTIASPAPAQTDVLGTWSLPGETPPTVQGTITVPLGLGQSMTLDPGRVSALGSIIRSVLIWVSAFGVFAYCQNQFKKDVKAIMITPQATTAGQSVFRST